MTTMSATEKNALRTATMSVASALERYANARMTPWTHDPEEIEQASVVVAHAFDALLAIEPEAAVRETYAWDQGRIRTLTTEQIRTLAKDYRSLASSPPEQPEEGTQNATLKQIRGAVGIITITWSNWYALLDVVKDAGLDVSKMSERDVVSQGLRIRAERQATGAAEARIVKKDGRK